MQYVYHWNRVLSNIDSCTVVNDSSIFRNLCIFIVFQHEFTQPTYTKLCSLVSWAPRTKSSTQKVAAFKVCRAHFGSRQRDQQPCGRGILDNLTKLGANTPFFWGTFFVVGISLSTKVQTWGVLVHRWVAKFPSGVSSLLGDLKSLKHRLLYIYT